MKMFSIVAKSSNEKTGEIAVSTSPCWTCPPACPFKDHGCYGLYGRTYYWWKQFSNNVKGRDEEYEKFLKEVEKLPEGTMWRHNQAGDFFPVPDLKNAISIPHAFHLSKVGKNKKGFTYTHYPVIKIPGLSKAVLKSNRSIVESLTADGFIVNISANSPAHADQIVDSGIKCPVVTVLPREYKIKKIKTSKTPKGRTILTCPATIKDNITCKKCKICLRADRDFIVGFPSHGAGFNHCERVLKEWANGVPIEKEKNNAGRSRRKD